MNPVQRHNYTSSVRPIFSLPGLELALESSACKSERVVLMEGRECASLLSAKGASLSIELVCTGWEVRATEGEIETHEF